MNLHRGGRLDEAETGYRECLHDGEVEAAAPLAALLLQQERYGEAVELLEPLARAAPDSAELAVNLSVGLRRSGRIDEALKFGRRACGLAPTQINGWNALGLAALELGRAEEALVSFESGLRLAPTHPALRLHRAHALRRLGRNGDALSAYTQTVQISPDLLDGWRGLASTQAVLDQVDEALLSRIRALALAPRDSEVAFEHSVALMRAGKLVEAIQGFEVALLADAEDAQAWAWLGRARLAQGDLSAARVAFEQARARDAHDPVIAHFYMAISGTLPAEVESDYIRCLFDDFADRFEHTLVQRLAYDTPAVLARFLRQSNADVATKVLDLGCGTGLMAQQLARLGRVIDGVDLSSRMLSHAREKGLYHELHAAELLAFLHASTSQWDLIVATDVFIYVADLQPVFACVRERLAGGGHFAFSIESSASDGTQLMPATGRYCHAPERVCRELVEAGFVDIARQALVLRLESGQPVAGELLLARCAVV